jgi:hypothetical protein
MRPNDRDPEDDLARLAQEATNQSTPDKALDEQTRRPRRRKVAPKRTKAPDA